MIKTLVEKNVGLEIRSLAKYISRYLNEFCTNDPDIVVSGSQGLILSYIYDHIHENIYQKDIEKEFNIRRSTATGLLQSLENKGYIEKQSVDFDARLKKLTLTQKAIHAQKNVDHHVESLQNKMLQGLSEEEIHQFIKIVEKMKENLLKESNNG